MTRRSHIIRSEYLHIEYKGKGAGPAAMNKKPDEMLLKRISSAIEEVLDRYAPSNGTLSVPGIKLDTGCIDARNLDKELPQRIADALEQVLQRHSLTCSPGQTTLPENVTAPRGSSKAEFRTEAGELLEMFLFFLNHGTLPWWATTSMSGNLEQRIMQLLSPDSITMPLSRLHEQLEQAIALPGVRKRLTTQFSADLTLTILQLRSPALQKSVMNILDQLEVISIADESRTRIRKKLLACALAISSEGTADDAENLVRRCSNELQHSNIARSARVALYAALGTTKKPPATAASIAEDGDSRKELSEPFAETSGRTQTQASLPPGMAKAGSRQDDAKTCNPATAQHPESSSGLFIERAGLVLLHPFLPQLFSTLGILDGGIVTNLSKAFLVLNYLATGHMEAMEYELVLSKILCGCTPEVLAEKQLELTTDEQEECRALLEAVIGHWQALKGTGIEAFRETFLERDGKLTLKESGEWLLQIETKSVDILLNQLPWSIAMIRLPWMPSILQVTWPS